MLAVMSSVDEPVRREAKAMEQALQRLRSLIVAGELSPGEQIRQQEMADQMGVSRVPLREALNVLAHQGLLLHRPHQGYFVAKRAPSELAQIRRMLQLLEDELLQSIEWPGDAVLKSLKKLNQEMRKCVNAVDWTPLVRKNREFHFQIFELSPHRIILKEVERLWGLADPFIALRMSSPDARAKTVEEHDQIIRALERRERKLCMAAMEQHRASTSTGLPPEL
jgi:DNA-binding GntR family transcriptional regulator